MVRACWMILLMVAMPVVFSLPGAESAGPKHESSDWSTPLNLGSPVNTSFDEAGPAISRDGLSLYFGSNRPGGSGAADLWVSTRGHTKDPWGTPANLGSVINSAAIDTVPALSPDEHWLFFNSTRPDGGFGDSDLWVSWRPRVRDPFGWQAPVNLGPAINTPFFDAGASLVQIQDQCDDPVENADDDDDGDDDDRGRRALLMFYGSHDDVYMSRRETDGSFGPAELVAEVNSPGIDARPHVSRNGREMILQSDRPGTLGSLDLFGSVRYGVCEPWAEPVNLGPVINGPARDFQAYLTRDGRSLYFSSDRSGGLGGQDLYVSARRNRPRHRQ